MEPSAARLLPCDNDHMGRLRRYGPFAGIAVAAALTAFAVAILRDIRASDTGVQGAVVGALAGVTGGVVGSAIGAWGVLTADQRRWRHEDLAGRKQRGVEAAREVRRELVAAATLFSHQAGQARFNELPEPEQRRRHGAIWAPPDDEAVDRYTTRAVDLAVEIPEEPVRKLVGLAASGLEQWDNAERWGAGRAWRFCSEIGAEADAFLGAYIRADDLPGTPEITRVIAVVDDYWATIRSQEAEAMTADEKAGDV